MAASWLCGSGALRAVWRGCVSLPVNRSGCHYTNLAWVLQTRCYISAPCSVTVQQCRQSSFFNKLTADELWKGVLAETGAGARKGRGKRTKKKFRRDLNRGQIIGEGRSGFLWPGLNIPVMKSGAVQTIGQRDKEEQEKVQSEIIRQRDEWEKRRKTKVKRERGWTGSSWGGISLGPPDPGLNGETYEDFDSRVIEVKNVFNMTAKEGRRRSVSALVVVGNGNGAADILYRFLQHGRKLLCIRASAKLTIDKMLSVAQSKLKKIETSDCDGSNNYWLWTGAFEDRFLQASQDKKKGRL